MPVEFALRPRIQLREAAPKRRRGRARLPRFALPAAAYWLVMGGATYAYVHYHRPADEAATADSAQQAEPEQAAPRAWWRRTSAPEPREPQPSTEPAALPPQAPPARAPAAEPEPEAALAPEATPEPSLLPEPPLASSLQPTRVARPPSPELGSPRLGAPDPGELPSAPAHASDPRLSLRSPLDVLEDRSPTAPEPAPVPAAPPSNTARSSGSLPSCEQAIASAHQDIDFSAGNGTADLPTNVIAAVLENGAWLSSCNVPANTALDVCVAIRAGNVIGASVTARPLNPELAACVRRRASGLQFPYSTHVDIARTRF